MKTRILLLFTTIFLIISNIGLAQNIQVPFISQYKSGCGTNGFHNAFCGHTSCEMVFAFYENRQPVQQNIFDNNTLIEDEWNQTHNSCGNGTANPNKLVWLAKEKGFYDVKWYGSSSDANSSGVWDLEDLKNEINSGFPVIVQVYTNMDPTGDNITHWMVLRQIDETNNLVYVNDPGKTLGNNKTYSLTAFLNCWNRQGSGEPQSRCVAIHPKEYINSNIDIYAGTVSNPISVDIWYTKLGITNGAAVNNLKINGNLVSGSYYPNGQYNPTTGKGKFTINLNTSLLTSLGITANGEYDISFDVDGANHHFFGADQLYFLDPTSLTDIQVNDWCKEYIYDGVELGLFKGNNNLFGKGDYLTRSQAAKVIVMAGIKLGILDLDLSTTGGTFTDVPISNWAFPFVQTLRNKGYITASTTFLPNDKITAGAFAKLLCNTLLITDADINSNQLNNNTGYLGSKISIQSTYFQEYLDRLAKIVVIKDDASGVGYVKSLASGLREITNSEITTSQVVFNGDNYITKAIMAKVLLNAYEYRLQNPAFSKSGTNVSNFVVVGDEFELTANTSGSVSSTENLSYTLESGQTQDIGFESEYSYGIPLFFYWVANGGQLTDLFPTSHKKVRFTAPTVSTPTNYTLYMFVGTGTGKIYYANITITVNPAGTSITEPTVQASNISFTNTTYNSVTVNWNRGNGQNCLVACTVLGTTYGEPQTNTLYNANANFSSALAITTGSPTKVVYTGLGNSVNITGLSSNTTYKIQIYEYNGTTTQNVKYLTNPAEKDIHISIIPPTLVDFDWEPAPIVAGSAAIFYSLGSNFTNCSWTFTGANISTSTAFNPSGVIFSTAGTYNVTLTNSNTTTGVSATITKTVTVVATNYLLPDLIVQNVVATPTAVTEFTTVNVSGIELNGGNSYLSNQTNIIRFYLSKDAVYDANDYTFTTDYNIASAVPASGSTPFSQNLTGFFSSYLFFVNGVGDYYILCAADGNSLVPESDETNNIVAVPVKLSYALPDLILTSYTATPTSLKSGATTTINYTVKNQGVGSTNRIGWVEFYLSTNSTYEAGTDISLGTDGSEADIYYTNPLPSNGTRSKSINMTIPSYLQSGTYYIIINVNCNLNGINSFYVDRKQTIQITMQQFQHQLQLVIQFSQQFSQRI